MHNWLLHVQKSINLDGFCAICMRHRAQGRLACRESAMCTMS
jgi:hypothetical protein